MNITTLRLRYTQLFLIGLFSLLLYIMSQSLSGGILEIENNVWGREFLVTTFTRLRLKLGDRVFSQGLVGKEGWLELTSGRNLDGYQNMIEMTPEALKNTQNKLQQLYEALRKRNIKLILVIPPDKANIYPDKLPNAIQRINPQSKLDMLTAYLQQHGPPVFLDLRPALLDGRKKQVVYYRTDTHWNGYGAFIAYREIMKELSKTYPVLTPRPLKDFKKITLEPSVRDIARLIGAAHLLESQTGFKLKNNNGIETSTLVLNNDRIPMQISITSNNKLPTLLMFHDSYGIGIKSFITPHFRTATFIENRSQYPDALSLKTIDAIKPDIVIVQILERLFNNYALDALLQQLLAEKVK